MGWGWAGVRVRVRVRVRLASWSGRTIPAAALVHASICAPSRSSRRTHAGASGRRQAAAACSTWSG